jgi:hypothetical protein
VIGSKIWASKARKQPSQAIDEELLSILSHVVSEKIHSAWMDSFVAVLPTPGYSSMYKAICEVTSFVLIDNVYNRGVPFYLSAG